MSSQNYRSIAQKKLSNLQSLIPKAWRLPSIPSPLPLDVRPLIAQSNILTAAELSITSSHDATSLSQLIHSKALTSEAVTIAFCKRAAIAQQLTNCLSEVLFLPAIEQARALDAEYHRTGKTRGLLHGIPISLKDTFKIKGYDSSIGIASLAENPARENSALVDILIDQGAILYCKTNVPQTLMALDSMSHLFGRVKNPRNRLVTAGGSSGGEGALVAMRGSILGVGTDVGGSIRIPAMCNGLYGIKPSTQRIPFSGQELGLLPGADKLGLQASAGPIATSARDCELFLKVLADAKPWEKDPGVAFGGWEGQGDLGKKPLFGILRTDGNATPLPPVAKVLDETVRLLRQNDVEVVEIESPAFRKCQSLANSFFGMEGNNNMLDMLEKTGEPLIPWLSGRLARKKPLGAAEIGKLHARKAELEKEMLGIWKDKAGRTIDVLICPVAPHPVPEIDRWNGVGYTSSFVLLDYAAGTLPVRDFVEGDLHGELPSDAQVLGSWDKRNRELWNQNTVDRNVYLNTKLSVQVVAPRLQERKLYQAMALIDEILREGGKEMDKSKL
ncbi:hypothetical protein QQS21_000016 [Conoideocrella luteorostrata]|uniref:amidase n=1 Tax=Conoideocrella luteorostrata TaxID=1105319 RepID=A0AAJ0G489_9HYPO|nr:hypothetical protein QQS21_000016 [Conoideocrella luteorostrata]